MHATVTLAAMKRRTFAELEIGPETIALWPFR
jgi:hypothetical protein